MSYFIDEVFERGEGGEESENDKIGKLGVINHLMCWRWRCSASGAAVAMSQVLRCPVVTWGGVGAPWSVLCHTSVTLCQDE